MTKGGAVHMSDYLALCAAFVVLGWPLLARGLRGWPVASRVVPVIILAGSWRRPRPSWASPLPRASACCGLPLCRPA
ncbi:hypothetical protein [Streptomyces sp. c-19]|uniref:hypothetical protein n=1 Tax=Streptomyces sp. c-19 TaxID=2789275 RepID=UPI00398016F0